MNENIKPKVIVRNLEVIKWEGEAPKPGEKKAPLQVLRGRDGEPLRDATQEWRKENGFD